MLLLSFLHTICAASHKHQVSRLQYSPSYTINSLYFVQQFFTKNKITGGSLTSCAKIYKCSRTLDIAVGVFNVKTVRYFWIWQTSGRSTGETVTSTFQLKMCKESIFHSLTHHVIENYELKRNLMHKHGI